MSYLKRFISFLSNSSLPAAHSVCTFHVPTVRVFLASFSFCVFFVVHEFFEFFPVTNFSTLPWFLGRGRGTCLPGRRLSRYGIVLKPFMVGFCRLVLFTDGGICTPSVKRSFFIRTCERHRSRWIAVSVVELMNSVTKIIFI
jgi:hypothetical protein